MNKEKKAEIGPLQKLKSWDTQLRKIRSFFKILLLLYFFGFEESNHWVVLSLGPNVGRLAK